VGKSLFNVGVAVKLVSLMLAMVAGSGPRFWLELAITKPDSLNARCLETTKTQQTA
jgi:hypothetical protein